MHKTFDELVLRGDHFPECRAWQAQCRGFFHCHTTGCARFHARVGQQAPDIAFFIVAELAMLPAAVNEHPQAALNHDQQVIHWLALPVKVLSLLERDDIRVIHEPL